MAKPNIVLESTNMYKSNNDIIQSWIDDRVVEEVDGARLLLKDCYEDFKIWYAENVPKEKPITKQKFQNFIEAKWGTAKRPEVYFEDKSLKNT